MSKYKVFATWMVGGFVIVEAEDEIEAKIKATELDLPDYDDQDYIQDSFEVEDAFILEDE